ncbi:MAG: alpha/beta hydrolase [Betaproteobacteria bacterium]|nr:alpha/beta hydrolase [Betaproteobacteria bacterium]
MLTRRFLNSPTGQLHAHEGTGDGTPLLLLHAAPGSARMLTPLQERFSMPSLAIDLPGMGDSAPLPPGASEPTIADFTAPIRAAVQFNEYDVYGTLSGARVALEVAATDARVRRVILDGIGIPKPGDLDELLERYAPPFTPNINGTHLTDTFLLCRDQYLFYPWYARDAEHRRPNGLPAVEKLHIKTMEALKSAAAFRPLIRAAFRYDVVARLKDLKQAALISADGAAIRPDLPTLTEPPMEPLTAPPENLDKRAAAIQAFLA